MVSEQAQTTVMLRDLLNESFNNIHVNDESLYEEIRSYIQTIAPQKTEIVKLYKGKDSIFDNFGVSRQIKGLFGKVVTIRNGVYLIIEHTEAMHVIDVNSGHRVNKENTQEENALLVNIEAAKEIARQLRLRDMGGIVIIDFIDMVKAENRKKLFDVMTEEMRRDKARHTILPLSKFGLMQITRQRVRPAMEVDVQEKCPFCDGTGHIKQSLVVVDEIEANIRHLTAAQHEKRLTLITHPYINAYLTRGGLRSQRWRWMRKYHVRLKLRQSEKYGLLDFKFFHANGDEIQL